MEPRVLSLKLALQQGSNFPQPSPTTANNTNTNSVSGSEEKPVTNHECDKGHAESKEGSGWSILRTLSQSSDCHNKTEDSVYVHPTVKRSSSILSDKSLEMCTESLGSETGSNAGDSTDDISLFSFDATVYTTLTTTTTTDVTTTVGSCESKRVNRACNFPPPLTTITDLGGVQVRPRREGGRLILEAVASSSPCSYFRAEREDGRLRLCLFEKFSNSEDEVCDVEEGVEEKEEEEEENEKSREVCDDNDSGAEEECVENVDEEMGVTKFSRPSSCKESGKREIFCDGLASLNFPLFLSVSV